VDTNEPLPIDVLGMTESVKRKAVAVQSRTSNFSAKLEFLVVPKITSGQNDVSKRKCWVVTGKVPLVQGQPSALSTICALLSTEDALLQQVKRFWELENCQRPSVWSIEDKQFFEEHFLDNHRRLPDGRLAFMYFCKKALSSNTH
jgi:hypothetical protein